MREFRKANLNDIDGIWEILKSSISKRKLEGSDQWQDGYPNLQVVEKDLIKNAGFVLVVDSEISGYIALMINDEPAYEKIKGTWISNQDYVVFHRLAVSENFIGKGMAGIILEEVEVFAGQNNINSIRADTNYDNDTMLHLFDKHNYSFRGIVEMRKSPRKAFEKTLI